MWLGILYWDYINCSLQFVITTDVSAKHLYATFFTSTHFSYKPFDHFHHCAFKVYAFSRYMAQVETNERVNDEDNELIKWLKNNRLLKVKQKFIDYEVELEDLKVIDLKHDLKLIIYNTYKLIHNITYHQLIIDA